MDETKATTPRAPTKPITGAGRDAFWAALVGWGAAAATQAVTSQTGDQALGELAGQGVASYGPAAVGAFTAAAAAIVTGIGKLWRDWRHGL